MRKGSECSTEIQEWIPLGLFVPKLAFSQLEIFEKGKIRRLPLAFKVSPCSKHRTLELAGATVCGSGSITDRVESPKWKYMG